MFTKKIIETMKEFKKELDTEKDFSPREKEILFEEVAKKITLEDKNLIIKNEPVKSVIPAEKEETDSFTSLINKTKITQHGDYVLGAIYSLMLKEGYENVNVNDINEAYKKAYLKKTNIGVYLPILVKKGFLDSAGKKEGIGAFTITRDGIKYIGELFKNGE